MPDRQKGNLCKRGKSLYVSIVIDGKLIRKSFGADRNAAEAVLAELLKRRSIAKATGESWTGLDELKAKDRAKSKITFAEVAEDYFTRERAGWKASTVETYRDILDCHLLPAFERKRIKDITTSEIADFRTIISEKMSPARCNRILAMLRSLLNLCIEEEIIRKNAANAVKWLKQPKPEVDPPRIDELQLALSLISRHYKPIFICLAWTGARPNELKALRWYDIDFVRKEIRITKGRSRGVESLPKTPSSQRTIPMLPSVEQSLLELTARQDVLDMDRHVFLNKAGKPIEKGLDQVWAKALKKAGLRHRPSYKLRHTFASLCIQQGIAPGWVAQTLGHTSLEMTFSRYARYIPEAMSEQHRKLAHLFGAQENSGDRAMHGIASTDTMGNAKIGDAKETDATEITKAITAPIIPISTATKKTDRVRRSRRPKKENKPTVGFFRYVFGNLMRMGVCGTAG